MPIPKVVGTPDMTSRQLPWNQSEIVASPQVLRSFFIVRNVFMKHSLDECSSVAAGFLEMVAQLRLEVIRNQPTVRSYVAYMLGGHAATPVNRCQFYGPTVHHEIQLQADIAETATIVDVLADYDPKHLPVLITILGGKRGSLEFVL